MRSPYAYQPHGGALGRAGVGAVGAWTFALATVAFLSANPLLSAALIAALLVAGALSGAQRAVRAATRAGLVLGLFVVAINALVVRRGETIWIRAFDLPLLGQIDITAEALAEGAALALRIWAVLLVFALFSARVNPDAILLALRRVAARSALTATLVCRLVPLAAADQARLREAVMLRGPGAAPVGRGALARRLLTGSLERSVDVAATLELRGYALARAPRRRGRGERLAARPADLEMTAAAAVCLAVAIGARLSGLLDFEAYPSLRFDHDPISATAVVAIAVIALLPLAVRAR